MTVQAPKSSVAGIGVGLRRGLADALFTEAPDAIAFVEIHPENYIGRGGRFRAMLETAQTMWPICCHGLTLCFGDAHRFEANYVDRLRGFLDEVGALWYSDHLCLGGVGNAHLHDLLPIPMTRESRDCAVARIRELTDALGRPVAVENVSSYAFTGVDEMDEPDFLSDVLERADAKLLLDVNNVYVNAMNHGFDAREYLDRIPTDRVVQIHVAGHLLREDGLRIDTHGEPICNEVYELLEYALRRTGPVPVLLERDQNLPNLATLLDEVNRLDAIYHRATEHRATGTENKPSHREAA